MSKLSRADRERELERALTAPRMADVSPETVRLAELARQLERLNSTSPTIDERRVWRRVREGMLAQPQAAARGRFLLRRLSRVAMFFALLPRPVLAVGFAAVLVAIAGLGSVLLQPRENASAAFLDEVRALAEASGAAAASGGLSGAQSAALEERALGLLDQASRPEVLGGLRPSEYDLAIQRLIDARSALAAVVGENPGDTRALAALAAISGILEQPESATAERGSTPGRPQQIEASPQTATATATAARAAEETPAVEPTASATATSEGRRPDPTRTLEAGDARGRGAAATPVAPNVGALVSATQAACARVYDSTSLAACTASSAGAFAACAEARGANGCQAAIEAAVGAAQQRVQRVGEDCQRLPSSRAREACSDATNRTRSNSGRDDERKSENERSNGRSGGGQRNESDTRGRRD